MKKKKKLYKKKKKKKKKKKNKIKNIYIYMKKMTILLIQFIYINSTNQFFSITSLFNTIQTGWTYTYLSDLINFFKVFFGELSFSTFFVKFKALQL